MTESKQRLETLTNGVKVANGVPNHSISSSSGHGPNAWSAPGSAAFDFRSASSPSPRIPITQALDAIKLTTLPGDTVTSPTASMLFATQNCTLQDDVFQEDPTTNSLEACIAEMTGKEAGLFVMSGTMGNQLSIRTALGGPPHSVLTDARSHVYGW